MRSTPQCRFRFRYDNDKIHIVTMMGINEEAAIKKAKKKYPGTGIKRDHNETFFNDYC